MKRRLFALLMAVVMIVTAIPAEVFAAGYGNVYGTNLGWEYAVISTNNDGGYSLKNPQTSSRVGTYYGDHVNVEFIDGTTKTAITEGSTGVKRNVLSKTSTVDVHVTCDYGYYISAIVLACAHQSDPFKCQTVATDDAYALAKPGSTLTNVTIGMSDIYEWAHHQSSVSTYYLMVELEPIPANVYVGYDAGTAGNTKITAVPVAETGTLADGATQVSSYPTWNYTTTGLTAAPTHSALNISPEAEAAANAIGDGYSFAGWHLEYYTAYTSSSNTFSGTMSVGGTNLPKGSNVDLTLHAKLTAIWQPMIEISVTKVWDDANNQDGIRPESIEVHLLKNDAHLGSPVTLNAANSWTASWKVPQKDENGNTITYHVEETVPTGYTTAVTGTAEDGFTLTNTHVVERTNVQAQKVWTDDNNRDGLRPYGVVVQLYKNGEAVTSYTDSNGNSVSGIATLTEATSWAHQWLDLEKNKTNGAGAANAYTVQEIGYVDSNGQAVTNPGYTVSYDTDETGRLVVENIHQVATMDIPVQKVWNDANNQDGIRPASVTVTLYADGTSTGKTLTLNAAGNWKGTFEDVYVNSAGTPINYSIVESASAGYTTAVTGTAAAGFTVTNTHTPETISVPVNKVWDDNENQDGIRPTSITVALYADGVATGDTLTLDASNNWAGAFAGKAKYKAGAVGTAIVYTVQETVVPTGYTATVNGTTITNAHTPLTATLNVHKVWQDFGNNDGKRADSVTVTLYANGVATSNVLTLNADNRWTGKWENMPRYHGGQRINYTVVETGYAKGNTSYPGIPDGYSVEYTYTSTDTEGTATVTNSYTPETVGLNIQKIWNDDDNREGLRPASVTVTLYQKIGNSEPTMVTDSDDNPMTAVLCPENEWDADFTGLPKFYNGTDIVYSVVETPVAGYDAPIYHTDTNSNVITIENRRTVNQSVTVTASKVWNDNNNQDGKRPGSVTITLYANGVKTTDVVENGVVKIPASITLDGVVDNNGEVEPWKAQWSGLYEYYRGQKIVYTVVEETVPTGYSVSVTGTAATGFTVTNTHTPETVSVPVTKVWSDANDQDGKRPDSITVELYANGSTTGKTLTLSASNNWGSAFTGIAKYVGGGEITYTVREVGELNNEITFNSGTANEVTYQVAYNDQTNTITNTYEPTRIEVSVIKVWSDSENADNLRPQSVTMHLLANGNHMGVDYKVTLTETTWTRYRLDDQGQEVVAATGSTSNWAYTWGGLDEYAEGLKINYTVYEEISAALTTGDYSANYTRNGNSITVTNQRDRTVTSFTAQKIWNDTNNQDNIRPSEIEVELFANNAATGNKVTLTAENHWRYTWTGLNKNENGRPVVYTVKETALPTGYTVDIEKTGADSHTGIYNLVNTHPVDKTSVKVTKVWNDANNQDGIRSQSITVTLYRNGVATTTTATLNDANNWTHTFTDLDVHHGIGIDNVYTVVESGVPAGYTSVTTGNATDGYIITNTHTPELISVSALKQWDDGNDQDGKRPRSITVALLADGVATGATIELNVNNNWTAAFDNLPKYKVGAVGDEVEYTVEEVNVPDGYTAKVRGNIITNSHTPELADLTVQKHWNDFGDNDGVRPYAVVIALYRNGQPALDETGTPMTVTLNADNRWTGEWEDMPRYHGGQRISYSVVETGYYQTKENFMNNRLEAGIPAGYTVTHSYDYANATAVITNSYTPATTSLNVQKVWDDDDNRDNKRPESVTITLWRKIGAGNWEPVKDSSGIDGSYITATMSAENEWDITFTGLPMKSQGQDIRYNVVETQVPGYNEPTYHYDVAARMVTITNSRAVETVNVTATKKWEDGENQDGIRPSTVVLRLYANGIRTNSTITLDGTKDESTEDYRETAAWVATWNNLLKYYHGVEIVYTVVEDNVADGYTSSVAKNSLNNYTITNTHIPATVSIPVTKTWADNNNQDGIRPETITVTLHADGVATNKTLTLKASENWIGSFGDLPAYANGSLIDYTVKEATIPGYTPTYSADDSTDGVLALSVTNTHTVEKTQLTVTKVWDDNNDQDGKRPDSIVVHLLANGVHTEKKVTVTADMDWTYTWTGLDKFAAGQEIVYTVYEEPVYFKGSSANGNARAIETYFASYVRNPEDPTEVIITNAYTPETTVITAMKVWDDGDNRDNLRSDKVTVELYADGTATGKTLTLNEKNDWVASWENLPKYKDHGKEIVYSVVENDVPEGYSVTIAQETEYAPGLFILSNVHSPALTNVSVVKAWNDHDDNDGLRPETVTVSLLCNGEVLYTTELSESSDWTHSWNGLYKYVAGKEAKYTVVETAVEGYTASYAAVSDTNGHSIWTVTNTHEKQTEELVVTTVWVDDNNSQKTRPDEVPAQLYKDGEPYGEIFKVTVNEDWQTTIVVPVFEDGKEIVWTVEQVQTPNPYTVTYNQGKLTIINTALFDDSPATGDSSNPVLLICLMAASCAGIAAILVLGRKKKRNEA